MILLPVLSHFPLISYTHVLLFHFQLLTLQGALTIKIWKRTVDADTVTTTTGPPPEQDIPLNVPKKTKLYVEQTQREREKAPDIHRAFQRDLCKLRLTTARAYVKTLTDGLMVREKFHLLCVFCVGL